MNKFAQRIRQVYKMYRPYIWIYLIIFTIVITIQGLNLTVPYLLGKIIDAVQKKLSTTWYYAGLLLAALLSKNIIDRLHGYFHVNRIAYDMEIHTEKVTLTKVLRLSIGQIMNHNSGFRHEVLKKGTDAMRSLSETVVFQMTPLLCRVLIALVFLFMISPLLGAIALSSIVAYVITSFIINKMILPELKLINKEESRLGTLYWEMMKHLRLIIVSHQEERAVNEYAEISNQNALKGKRMWQKYFNRVSFIREPFASIGLFAVLCACIYLVNSGRASAGLIVMAMGWSQNAFDAMSNIGSLQRRFARESVQVARYFDLLEIDPVVKEAENPITPNIIYGKIEFRDVSFEYPKFTSSIEYDDEEDEAREKIIEEEIQASAIKNVSFTIEAGTTCAFVGPSGAGKSTVINLLIRGYDPQQGQILIDGHDLRLLNLGLWRKSIGIVEQDPKLWDDTLKRNMLYCVNGESQNFSESDLEDLARRTRIDEFYNRLGKKRFDTYIGENGVQLSGGQRQRVAIARAIAKSPSVLIFDEATNALDPPREKDIQRSIGEALIGRTGIIIAHRLSTIRRADQILVFDQGGVVGKGKHHELLESCQTYRSLVEHDRDALGV